MRTTRADILRSDIAFALMRLKIQSRKGVLTDAQRYEIADLVVKRLRRYGDPWRLDEPVPEPPLTPSWDWKA